MQARLKNVRISARKIGLAAKLVRNFKVSKADATLKFTIKKSANILRKLINSAVANAVNAGEKADNLKIKSIFVGPGVNYKRFMPRAKGSASPILKRTSNVWVVLEHIDNQQNKTKKIEVKPKKSSTAIKTTKKEAEKETEKIKTLNKVKKTTTKKEEAKEGELIFEDEDDGGQE